MLTVALALAGCGAPAVGLLSGVAGLVTAMSGLDEQAVRWYLALKGRPVGACSP